LWLVCSWAGSRDLPGRWCLLACLVFPGSSAILSVSFLRLQAVVSPADGKVTDVSWVTNAGEKQARISIFLSVFDVHVNRSPIAGIVRDVRYRKGNF